MSRLLILFGLLYLLYRKARGGSPGRTQSEQEAGSVKHDILIEDPVCHTYVPKSQAVSLDRGDKIYYFCSRKCRDAFCRKEEQP
ncbi:MAG: YHS domain-containing protein [Desulfobacteraceae bacterium]|nr:YHS domain-containing protein [Desulfobacteraceae bacterium]